MIEAPAEVPATTAPRSCARVMAAAIGVPTKSWLSLSWLPPVMKTPVALSMARTDASPAAARRERGLTTTT